MNPARAYDELNAMERMARGDSPVHQFDARIKIIVAGVFLALLLSVGPFDLPGLLTMAVYPLIMTLWARIPPLFMLKRALWVLPFVVFIGVFNPVFNREPAFYIGSWAISSGWVSFTAIIFRGIIAVWAALLLLTTTGFNEICLALNRLKVPPLLTTQFLFVFRYLFVLIDESLHMLHARSLRNGGRKKTSLRDWSSFVGTLLLRSLDRAKRLHQALLARGFDGEFKTCCPSMISSRDISFLFVSIILICLIRFGDLANRIGALLEKITT